MDKDFINYINTKISIRERDNEREFINAMVSSLYSSDCYFTFSKITNKWRKHYRKLYAKFVFNMNYWQKNNYLTSYINWCFKKYEEIH